MDLMVPKGVHSSSSSSGVVSITCILNTLFERSIRSLLIFGAIGSQGIMKIVMRYEG